MLSSFQSRVARRVFGLFFLSTVVPVMVTIMMIAAMLSWELEARHLDDLQQDAKSYGLVVFERLEFVAKGLDAWIEQGAPRSALSPGVLEARLVRPRRVCSRNRPIAARDRSHARRAGAALVSLAGGRPGDAGQGGLEISMGAGERHPS